jgi:hypothetical protein
MPAEIDGASNLYLADGADGDREGFVRAFREVWHRIPERFREGMIREWQKGITGQPSSPIIRLVRGYRYSGGNEAFGHTLIFNADVARLMQEAGLLPDLIAHELGHVWHYPVRGAHVANPHATWNQRECEADRLATYWGFNMPRLREWADTHGAEIAEMTGTRHVSWKVDCAEEEKSRPLWADLA